MSSLHPEDPADKAGPIGVRALGPFKHVNDLLAEAAVDPRLFRAPLALRVLMRTANAAASSGKCWRSTRKLADQLRTDRSSLGRAVTLLERLGYFRTTPGRGDEVTCYFFPVALDRGRNQVEANPDAPPAPAVLPASNRFECERSLVQGDPVESVGDRLRQYLPGGGASARMEGAPRRLLPL